MLKRFFCGAVLVATLCGSGVAPVQADEVFVRNRPFKDAYFVGGETYVPVEAFLKAVRVSWSMDGSSVVVGKGSSPDLNPSSESLVLMKGGEKLDLNGVLRDGRLYVPAKPIAKFVGYGVRHNKATGIVDVVKARFISGDDEKAAEDVVAANDAEEEKIKSAWQKRVKKARAERKKKEEEEKARLAAENGEDEDEDEDEDGEDEDTDSEDEDMDSDSDEDEDSDSDSDEDEDSDSDEDEDEDKTSEDETDKPEKEEKKDPPPKADLVILSKEAEPNNYSGEVIIKATLQNQGFADATNVNARVTVLDPAGKPFLSQTVYRGPVKPDGRWEIRLEKTHKDRGGMPRGSWDIKVTPSFQSASQ